MILEIFEIVRKHDCIRMIYVNDVSNLIAPSMLICVSQTLLPRVERSPSLQLCIAGGFRKAFLFVPSWVKLNQLGYFNVMVLVRSTHSVPHETGNATNEFSMWIIPVLIDTWDYLKSACDHLKCIKNLEAGRARIRNDFRTTALER